MKVLIVDGLHDSDRGGAGIVAGLVDSLYSVALEAGKSLELGLVYRYSADDKRFHSAARHTHRAFPDLQIFSSPVRTFSTRHGLLKKLDYLGIFLGAFLKLVFPSLHSHDMVRAMRNADLVISKGGHFYQSEVRNSISGFVDSFLSVYNLLLVICLGKRFALIAHSVGPFKNSASRNIVTYVFKKASFVSTREEISRDILVSLGIEASRIKIVPDTAFALTPADPDDVLRYLEEKGIGRTTYVVITARYWNFPTAGVQDAEERYKAYLSVLAEVADRLLEAGHASRILLVVHNDGQHLDFEDDSKPVLQIFNAMRNQEKAVVIDDDLSPAIQSSLYGGAVLTIGTRMHSVIFALVGGGPAIAVSYSHKTDGMMDLLGMGQYVLPIDSMDSSSALEMSQKILDQRASIMQKAEVRIEGFRSTIRETLGKILSGL